MHDNSLGPTPVHVVSDHSRVISLSLTNPDIRSITVMQVLDIFVHLPGRRNAYHPELRNLRDNWSGILIERVHRREAVCDDRASQNDVEGRE